MLHALEMFGKIPVMVQNKVQKFLHSRREVPVFQPDKIDVVQALRMADVDAAKCGVLRKGVRHEGNADAGVNHAGH